MDRSRVVSTLLILHSSIEDLFRARLLPEGYSRREKEHEEARTHRIKDSQAQRHGTSWTVGGSGREGERRRCATISSLASRNAKDDAAAQAQVILLVVDGVRKLRLHIVGLKRANREMTGYVDVQASASRESKSVGGDGRSIRIRKQCVESVNAADEELRERDKPAVKPPRIARAEEIADETEALVRGIEAAGSARPR
jgi:hypothetical protein